MLENIKSDFINFGGIELMGKVIIILSFFILGIRIIKDINKNIEILTNYKSRKREIIHRIIYYAIFFINTIVIILGIFNIKLLNLNLFWVFVIGIIYLVLRKVYKIYLNDKKDIVEIYKDGKLIGS
ncbi:hypothetical protein [Clostridium cuniculi]|uniref:hypothetical protein n=1 Tax=Clostridium cuniculi TaxID=2548455 RepID=UPI0010542510|nr:hypothetical protein [Clostridium cuniculi]